MVGAKVAEQVIVHAHFPTDPQVGQVAFAEPSQVTGAADPFDDGEHPQRHQNLRIDRVSPDAPFHSPNLAIQRRQVERVDIRPNGSHAMIFGNHLIQGRIPPLNLIPLRPLHPHFRPRNASLSC